MLRRSEGATVDEVANATGSQRHTVRGVFSGTLKKKLGLSVWALQPSRARAKAVKRAPHCRTLHSLWFTYLSSQTSSMRQPL